MIFDSIINIVKERFGISQKSGWISERLNELEIHRENFDTLPFKIVELKNFGFLTKVKGLYSFIPFNYMPWKYSDNDSWIAIAPSLINKKFFCKIHEFDKDRPSIILSAELPQFKKAELINGEEYNGLITRISDFGVFIDIGYHFDWRCGSLIGLLHKSQLADNEELSDFRLGQEITTIFQEMNENGQPVFSNDRVKTDWQMGKPQELVGQTIWVNVARQTDNKIVNFLVKGKYKADLIIDKQIYPSKYRKKIINAKKELSHGEIINCEVTGFNERNKTLKINWLTELDTEIKVDNSILNNLDDKTIEKLITLRKNMSIQIIDN
jgi:ribosomal protein S1